MRRFVWLLFGVVGCSAPATDTQVRSAAPPQPAVQSLTLADARPAGLAGTIIFHADREGRHRLFTVDLTSGVVTRLTEGRDHHDEDPVPSPDGTRIAFRTTRFDYRTWDIAVMDAQGGAMRRVRVHPAFDRDPAWTPDGSSLLFASEQDGTQAVYRVALDSGAVTRVSPEPERALMPSASPDGTRIAYTMGTAQGLRIVVHDTVTGAVRAVTPEGADCADVRWSPDGAMLAYARLLPGGGSVIEILRVDTGETRAIAVDGLAALREPAWSPDGRWIAAAASASAGAKEDWDLVLFQAASPQAAHRLTSGGANDRSPSWLSP